jgi:hypothetical protein
VKTPQIFASADRTVFRRLLADAKPLIFASATSGLERLAAFA